MPTAADNLVTIKWVRLECMPIAEGGPYRFLVETLANVNGELVRSFTQFNLTELSNFNAEFLDALDVKRMDYVTP